MKIQSTNSKRKPINLNALANKTEDTIFRRQMEVTENKESSMHLRNLIFLD